MATPRADPRDRWTSTVVLGDGSTATIRPIEPADAAGLREFHLHQSSESVYRRFFSPKPDLSPAELDHFTDVDFVDRAALVVTYSSGAIHDELLAWASYERWPGRDDAETAFMVDDRHHGKGIATLLLEHLAAIAASNGIRRFTAEVLADNRAMISVFARAGWPVERHFDSGVIDVDFAIAETEEFLDSVSRREQRADSRAMARLLLPRSIAVVGATDRPGSVGETLWRHVAAAATGPVYAVNPNRTAISLPGGGTAAVWPRLAAVPDDISLAVVAVPATALAATLRDCAAAGVRGAVITTSVEGTDIDAAALIRQTVRDGVRVIGPSSMGVASTRPDIGLQASLAAIPMQPADPDGGGAAARRVALSLQSGSLGSSVLRRVEQLGLGLSWFVSLGDRADVSGNDLLQFWDDDETTAAIGMYTETFGNPRRFARIARRVSRRRPIVAVRTGAAAIGPLGSALYQQSGLIEVPTVPELLDTLRFLAGQPVLRGRNVAVLSNSRSPSTLAGAALTAAGLRTVAPPLPLDWRATPDDYVAAIAAALADPRVDGLMVIHAPPLEAAIAAPVADLDATLADAAKPAAVVLLGAPDGPLRPGSAVPAFAFPEPAAAALGRSYAYGRWLDTEAAASPVALDDVDADRVGTIIAAALTAGRVALDVAEVTDVLAAYGIAMPATRYVAATAASGAADELGYPVAVKARRRHVGRTVEAGVALDLADAADVTAAVARMGRALGSDADHVVVQAMATSGVDLRIRVVADPGVGPLVTVGIGGSQADLVADERPRLAPLSTESAVALLEESRASIALRRGGFGSGFAVETTLRAAQLAAEHPAIATLDLNPVIATPDACVVTDATIRIAPGTSPAGALRHL